MTIKYRIGRAAFGAALGLGLAVGFFAPAKAGIPQIEHVVIIVQENRTPDNLFHGLEQYLPQADIANTGVNSKGQVVKLQPISLRTGFDLDHSHLAFTTTYDGGKMDKADLIRCYAYFV